MTASKIFRYEQVAIKVEETIATLRLVPGDKIPSVRKVSKELQVSMNTVFQALSILEAKGLLISRPRSGFIVNAITTEPVRFEEQATLALPSKVEITAMATAMMKNAKENGIINFSVLAPITEFLPVTKINKAVKASLDETINDNYQYALVDGHPRLLKQIARLSFEWDKAISPDKILVTNGSMEAINLCLEAITKPGDIVAIESPTYHGILQSLESRGLKALEIRTHPETGLNLNELELALSQNKVAACLFMPRCNNPIGCSMPEGSKIKLVAMLGERNIPLIEDDTLGELYYQSNRPLPAKAYDNYDNVLYCSSFSKTLAPGFRIGWVSAGKYHGAIEKLKFRSNISTTSILQDAIGRYLDSGQYDTHLRRMRLSLQKQMIRYVGAITSIFPPETRLSVPQGGLSVWIELPAHVDAYTLQKLALKEGIGICPGHIFSANSSFQHFIRINYCPIWNSRIQTALVTISRLIQNI